MTLLKRDPGTKMKTYKVTLLVDEGWLKEIDNMAQVAYTDEVFQYLSMEEVNA